MPHVLLLNNLSYLRQDDSFSRLNITKETFKTLVYECGIFAEFAEYVVDFRWKMKESEVGPPPIRFRLFDQPHPAYDTFPSGIDVSRSQVYIECAYGVRHAEFTNRPAEDDDDEKPPPFSLRQLSVYQKYVPKSNAPCSTWVLVGQSQRTEKCLDQYVNGDDQVMGAHPFELHIIFLDAAIASWRPYLAHLLEEESQVVSLTLK